MKTNFEVGKRSGRLSLSLIPGVLIILFGIIGCSDIPYTGQVVTVKHVDQYLNTIEQDTLCLQDGFDTVCIKLLLDELEIAEGSMDYTPIVHVHPTSLAYVFQYKGKPILQAKRVMDTTHLVQGLVESGRAQLPPDINNVGNSGAQGNNPQGWVIQIYYPDAFPEAERGRTPKTSGLDIKVVEGLRVLPNNQRDLRINNFEQTHGPNGSRALQFSLDTEASEITIQVGRLVPDHIAIFHISADDVESDQQTNVLQLQPEG